MFQIIYPITSICFVMKPIITLTMNTTIVLIHATTANEQIFAFLFHLTTLTFPYPWLTLLF